MRSSENRNPSDPTGASAHARDRGGVEAAGLDPAARGGRVPSSSSDKRRDFVGVSMTALCGGALALNMMLILALLAVIGWQGARYFWQKEIHEFTLADGRKMLGEIHAVETIPAGVAGAGGERIQLRLGNRDLTGSDFQWVDASSIASRALPPDAVVLERLEWGNFYGRMVELRRGAGTLARGGGATGASFAPLHETKVR